MNEVERASQEILIALVIDYHRTPNDVPDLTDLKKTFHLKMPDFLVDSSIEVWEGRDWLIISRAHDGTSARIKSSRYSAAHAEVLAYLGATTMQVDWQKEEVLSDATNNVDFPLPDGWKLYTFDNAHSDVSPEATTEKPTLTHDSASWTGLPKGFVFTDVKRVQLAVLLRNAETGLDALEVTNSEKAQARALIIAARELIDAPEPPVDLIWEIVSRANSLSGIASLFVSIVALFLA